MAELPALVVLAGGASSRLGEPKALVQLGSTSVLEALLEAATGTFAGRPLVIAGAHEPQLRAAAPAGVEVAPHPTWRQGRTGSVALAASLRPGCDLLVAPVDVPRVPSAVFRALARAWRRSAAPAHGWLAPVLAAPGIGAGRFGHPICLGRELCLRLVEMDPDEPLRELRSRARTLLRVCVTQNEILEDLDGPEDLELLRRRQLDRA